MLLPIAEINDTAISYLPTMKRAGFAIYYLVIVMVFLGLGSLFFIRVSISVRAPGIIRPLAERTAIRSPVPGVIDSLYFKEGDRVEKNAPILSIRDRAELLARQEDSREQKESYCIRAPVSGVLQGLGQRYPGNSIQPDETICTISPEGRLVGECYVSTRDAGMLKPGQPVRFQIDAFNYNYFGVAEGRISSVANDYTLLDNKPVFKIICLFDQQKSKSGHGYRGQLKKGLGFSARFISGSRTLWQLLYDTMDEWMNPLSPGDSPLEKKGL